MVTAAREFQVMVKPMGAVCNLACGYCYYLKKKDLYPQAGLFRMADDLLERYIVQHIEACPKESILFSWHGGEPTVLGLDYFRRIVELQHKHRPAGREILNGIQTNGTLLDEEWCRFLAAEGFYVGLSMDGPKEFHDRYRVTKGEKTTHKQVLQSFRLLQQHRISCDVLCVVHHHNGFVALRYEKTREEVEAEETEQYQLFETSQYKYRAFVTDFSASALTKNDPLVLG